MSVTSCRRPVVFGVLLLAVSLISVAAPVPAMAFDNGGRQGVVTGEFGGGVAVSGRTLVVGATGDDDAGENAGAVLVYSLTRRGWVQTAKLTASDAEPGDGLGSIVDISGGTIVARSSSGNEGSVYAFSRTGAGWAESGKLTAPDGVYDFGRYAVEVSGGTAVVGTNSDLVYVFERTRTGWVESAVLTASDGTGYDLFGIEVDIDGDTIVATNIIGGERAAAYVFTRLGNSWVETAKLRPDNDRTYSFGWDVAVSGDLVVVSDIDGSNEDQDRGLAYVYRRTGDVWTAEGPLAPSDAQSLSLLAWFGWTVDISGDKIVVGGYETGGVYVYKDTPIGWVESEKLTSPDGGRFSSTDFSIGNDTIAVSGIGTVYLFVR